ncbi:hypothetical protein PINS_up000012 [Pythium insidiosum]|nr:hypothetical protein PINS_up000012 [Pythium insidiosum]
MAFSIDDYKRKMRARAAYAKAHGGRGSLQNFAFSGFQQKYLDFCVGRHLNPDHRLLTSLK